MEHNALPPLELSAESIQQISSPPTVAPTPNHTSLFNFSDGDVRIRVQYQGQEIVGSVLSQPMSLASPVWSKFISPPWVPEGAEDIKQIDFREDGGEAVLILLRIVHYQFSMIPAKLSRLGLYNLALMCEQYDCHNLVKPWLEQWMAVRPPNRPERIARAHPEWLYISWAFGYAVTFHSVAEGIILLGKGDNLYCDEDEEEIRAGTIYPDKIGESMLAIRKETLRQLIDLSRKAAADFLDETRLRTVCQQGDKVCDQTIYGKFVVSLNDLGIWQGPPSSNLSIQKLYAALIDIADECFPEDAAVEHGMGGDLKLSGPARALWDGIPSPVLDCHQRHMERRRAELAITEDLSVGPKVKRRKLSRRQRTG